MNVRPLTGQALIQLLPPERESAGGIVFPQRHRSAEEKQEAARKDPESMKEPPGQGIVVAIGPWRRSPNGYGILPDFGVGARVVIGAYSGQQLRRGIGERLKLVNCDDVLAVIQEIPQ